MASTEGEVVVTQDVRDAQMQNGLRHSNFQQYREYCTRRLQRVRKAIKFHYGRQKFQKKTLEPHMVKNERYLLLPLVSAERAWAYARQLQSELTLQPERRPHFLRRLSKAATWARLLKTLCDSVGDERTQLEAMAYEAFMNGNLLLEREDFGVALVTFACARMILQRLAAMTVGTLHDTFEHRLSELEPALRKAFYFAMGGAAGGAAATQLPPTIPVSSEMQAILDDKFKKIGVLSAAPDLAGAVSEVKFAGRTLPVRVARIGTAISAAEKAAETASASLSKFTAASVGRSEDKTLSELDAALHAWRAAVRFVTEEQRPRADRDAAYEEELRLLSQFVRFHLLDVTIARQCVAAVFAKANVGSGKGKPDEIARLYRKGIISANDIAELQFVKDNAERVQRLKIISLILRSHRSVFLALKEAAAKQWGNANGLLDTAQELAAGARDESQRLGRATALGLADKCYEIDVALGLPVLQAEIDRARVRVRAQLAADNQQQLVSGVATLSVGGAVPAAAAAPAPSKTVGPLSSRLHVYDDSVAGARRLVDPVPQTEAIPCKPLFFDLSSTDIDFPDLRQRQAKSKPQAAAPAAPSPATTEKKKGFLGLW